jgi:hypothetical protein
VFVFVFVCVCVIASAFCNDRFPKNEKVTYRNREGSNLEFDANKRIKAAPETNRVRACGLNGKIT